MDSTCGNWGCFGWCSCGWRGSCRLPHFAESAEGRKYALAWQLPQALCRRLVVVALFRQLSQAIQVKLHPCLYSFRACVQLSGCSATLLCGVFWANFNRWGLKQKKNGELLRGFPSKYVLYLVISETKSRNDQTYNWGSDSGSDLLTHHLHLPHHLVTQWWWKHVETILPPSRGAGQPLVNPSLKVSAPGSSICQWPRGNSFSCRSGGLMNIAL